MPRRLRRLRLSTGFSVLLLIGALSPIAAPAAQTRSGALSDAEVEQIREARYVPSDAISLFMKFLDSRADRIAALYAKPRRPGREQDTHDLIEQFSSIADELDDNLEDYGPRHADLRKALPKLLEATDRWATELKTPPENDAYAVSRKIALESIKDLKDEATQLNLEQVAWFKAHPPAKAKASGEDGMPIGPR